MAREEVKRSVRVGERIRAELMEMLLRGDVRDPGVADVLVSAVRVSDDLGHARVYLRRLESASEKEQERAVAAMDRASGFMRRELARRLALRAVPPLRFYWDASVDHGMRMEEVLDELRRERSEAAPPTKNEGSDDDERES
jgi:ribosome-binding factor A